MEINKNKAWIKILAGVVIGIILGVISVSYLTRGMQGRLRSATDDIGGQYLMADKSYEPNYKESKISRSVSAAPAAAVIRKVIQNANLSIRVKDSLKVQVEINNIVTKYNGMIISSQIYNSGENNRRGTTVLKVLPANMVATLVDIKKLGEVENENVSGEDVTEQYVDLQARLQNYKIVKDRLTKIMDEKAREVKDILEIEKEMARVGGEIEALEGRIKYLDSQADMATVTVNYYEKQVHIVRGLNFKERFQQTLKVSVEVFVNTINGMIILISFLLPIMIVLFVIWGVIKLIKKIKK
ncbi:MAG: DUF4349 domain-containing protein [Candidatus Omnitrophica bacterium]|nr:DUF4349 domain-containing protein [Candidatus Omnitrophota bacterium]